MRLASAIGAFIMGVCSVGCSPGYVLNAAYHQSKILLGRRSIDKVIDDPSVPSDDKDKLKLVPLAREFSGRIGLKTGDSFTSYTDIGKDTLAWIVVASRKDSFALYTWWFPIVGTVPYKGFFDKESAMRQARALDDQGYESSVRGTEAFSTLGWFNDPVLSTTLKNPPGRIVNTVIHESVHPTVWIKNNVAFNESLANFVGSGASVQFFSERRDQCRAASGDCAALDALVVSAERDRDFQMEFGDVVNELYAKLDALYSSPDLSGEEKIQRRDGVFQEATRGFRAKYPKATVLEKVHNADIMQYKLYLTELRLFERVFRASGSSWEIFFQKMADIARIVSEDSAKDPFKELHNTLKSG